MRRSLKFNSGLTSLASVLIVIGVIVIFGGIYLLAGQYKPSQALREEQIIGGDKDPHGCLIAAGYSWCDATQTCIRQWETYCTDAESKTAVFNCDDEKTITATFYPADDQYVDLILSDKRALSAPRTISASGARYAKADETLVFWNKGDTAFITEDDITTFENCVTGI
ncbi:MAG: MliC family protein [Candidatus Colwellbacteria bacterium]|nr:MliC family protein [Candidatus Colwellbacteria bacterium]